MTAVSWVREASRWTISETYFCFPKRPATHRQSPHKSVINQTDDVVYDQHINGQGCLFKLTVFAEVLRWTE